MKFVEAYSQANPALQQQIADLPRPQHLYSMGTEGRLSLATARHHTGDHETGAGRSAPPAVYPGVLARPIR